MHSTNLSLPCGVTIPARRHRGKGVCGGNGSSPHRSTRHCMSIACGFAGDCTHAIAACGVAIDLGDSGRHLRLRPHLPPRRRRRFAGYTISLKDTDGERGFFRLTPPPVGRRPGRLPARIRQRRDRWQPRLPRRSGTRQDAAVCTDSVCRSPCRRADDCFSAARLPTSSGVPPSPRCAA